MPDSKNPEFEALLTPEERRERRREEMRREAARKARSEKFGQAVALVLFFGLLGSGIIWLIVAMWRSILGV